MPPTKQEIISRATSAVMHILRDSHLFGSDLWPENGFKAGYPREGFVHDGIYVSAKVDNYPMYKEDDQRILINMQSNVANRVKAQALEIDIIMENAIYDSVLFKIWLHTKLGYSYRYHLTGIGSYDNHGLQLQYTFTIND